jgi:hypothetical protein
MSTARLQVTNLDFDTIKASLKNYLKQQSEFQDYDFEGSGLSVLIDLLAYNTHYNAYYLNMVANEAFLDTAILRDSVVSHAKVLNYTPRSVSAPVARITIIGQSSSNTSGQLYLPNGFTFLSNQIDGKSYNFTILTTGEMVTKSNTTYRFENIPVYEGQLVSYNFTHSVSTNPKQVFTLPDSNLDSTTIQVSVTPSAANSATSVYSKVSDVTEITATDEIFFLQENRNGKYQIYFGNDVVGKSIPDGATVTVSYLVTHGADANKADSFIPASVAVDSLGETITSFNITTDSVAAGGADRESVDSIKYSSTAQFSAQNRLVTYKDYETFILNTYSAIDAVSVWGGEDNIPPVYGKVFVSIKTKDNLYLSQSAKQSIIDDLIKPKAVLTVQTEIIEPEYLYIQVDNKVQFDPNKTSSDASAVKNAIRNSILNYRNRELNRFNSRYIESKLQDEVDNTDVNAILGSEVITRLQKRFEPVIGYSRNYTVKFNTPIHRGTISNKLTSTEFVVNDSQGIERTVTFDEVPQSYSGMAAISVTNPGTGYTSTPTVTITGDGVGATAEALIVNEKIQSITITNRGIGYTRAIVNISGGSGYGSSASAVIDSKIGTLRTIYYDTNAELQIVNENAGEINYDLGIININDINIRSIGTSDRLIRLTIESEKGLIQSVRNTIITIDETDPTSIVTTLEAV